MSIEYESTDSWGKEYYYTRSTLHLEFLVLLHLVNFEIIADLMYLLRREQVPIKTMGTLTNQTSIKVSYFTWDNWIK